MHRRLGLLVGSVVLSTAFLSVASAQNPDDETPADEGICDELHGGTPGLYGLCVAFCEAHDCEPDFSLENPFENCRPVTAKVLARYDAKKLAGDPDMPCLAAGDCPCFTQTELESLPPQDVSGQYSQCDDMPPITNIIASFSPLNVAQIDESSNPPMCIYSRDGDTRNPGLTAEEAATCRDLIVSTIETSPYCPQNN